MRVGAHIRALGRGAGRGGPRAGALVRIFRIAVSIACLPRRVRVVFLLLLRKVPRQGLLHVERTSAMCCPATYVDQRKLQDMQTRKRQINMRPALKWQTPY